MNRADVIAKLKSVEPALREHGVAALYLFGSYARDEARPESDIDVFVEPANEEFYGLNNYMGTYERLQAVFPGTEVGYSTRKRTLEIRPAERRGARNTNLLMAASKSPRARLHHILDEAMAITEATRDLTFEAFNLSWLNRRAVEHGLMIITEASKALPSNSKPRSPRFLGRALNRWATCSAMNTKMLIRRCSGRSSTMISPV